jgi:hypothetical protein
MLFNGGVDIKDPANKLFNGWRGGTAGFLPPCVFLSLCLIGSIASHHRSVGVSFQASVGMGIG